MQSDNLKRAKAIIATYPEVFESLLEFERTKKIPKLYRRKRINLTIDENILRQFQQHAQHEAITMSRFVEKQMLAHLAQKATQTDINNSQGP